MAVADSKTRRELEFDQILSAVSELASSRLGRERTLALEPLSDRDAIVHELEAVDEGRRLTSERPDLKFFSALDRTFLQKVTLDGFVLDAESLLALRDTYRSVSEIHEVADSLEQSYPIVLAAARSLPYHGALHARLEKVFTARGEVADDASEELATLRRQQRTLRKRIEQSLERLLRDADRNRYLAEDYFTQIGDRYVVLVKADFKGRIPGIVQGESSSGLSLYVEPLEVVDSNNACIEARVEEAREIRRILRELSEAVHAHRSEYPYLLETLAWLDSVAARARYAGQIDASSPTLDPGLGLNVIGARHPLLGRQCVPIHLALGEGERVVVISGVNSGGKTVALKMVGLLSLMAQSGMHVAASPGTVIPLFDRIASEIGDQQSIAQNLSSFSSHVTHVAQILESLGERSLLLFDEFMTGTDPEEGSSLAEAILADLARRETLTLVTTHYGPLKLLQKKYERFANVAVEFDWERLAPTFRLLAGLPGSSLGIDIALRFGLDPNLVEAARNLVDTGQNTLTQMVKDLEEQLQTVQDERERLARLTGQLEAERADLSRRWEERELDRQRRLEELREADLREMESLKARVHQALQQGPPPQLPAQIHETIRRKETELEASRPPRGVQGPLGPGDWVKVAGMKDPGVIVQTRPDKMVAVVLVNGIQVKTKLSSLERTTPPPRLARAGATRGGTVGLAVRDLPYELNLISLRVEEALEQLSDYLDAAVARSYKEVRVVHGKGTGALRAAVERFLKGYRHVKSHRLGTYGEGESGVTVVTLK
ncbi:MAG: endonuclease MutS2 [Candidatus Riflebacteria bacterium]|nr:endonuclease MutS2 [Candidatus Riflebacteria bacterium]